MDQVNSLFVQLLLQKGITVSDQQLKQFDIYFNELITWNEKMNLTGITEKEQVYSKHFYDSISLSFFVSLTNISSIADIGSGAGFPSIPLKIMYPHVKVTIVDSLNKRIQFLEHLTKMLQLEQMECIHGRAEEISRKHGYRDRYDLVTARAVARLAVLNEFCLPFVKKDGLFVAMKGSDPTAEVSEAEYSANELKAKLMNIHSFELPEEHGARHIIVYRKNAATPAKYPRKTGIPLKSPLIK